MENYNLLNRNTLVKMLYYILFIIFCFVVSINHSYAKKNYNSEATLSAKLQSDSSVSEKEFLLKLKSRDKKEKYLHNLSINFDNEYSKITNIKIKELFDYQQKLLIYRESKKNFLSLYIRYKEDNVNIDSTQNYQIYSLGYGLEKKHEDKKIRMSFSIGLQNNRDDSIIIYTPNISYENSYNKFKYTLSSSLTSGDNFSVFTNKAAISYPFTKKLSLKYLIKYELSKDGQETDFERLNKIALAIKF
jgi:uncharacterized surface anchored protein